MVGSWIVSKRPEASIHESSKDNPNVGGCALDNFSLSSDGTVAKNAKDVFQAVKKEGTETLATIKNFNITTG